MVEETHLVNLLNSHNGGRPVFVKRAIYSLLNQSPRLASHV